MKQLIKQVAQIKIMKKFSPFNYQDFDWNYDLKEFTN